MTQGPAEEALHLGADTAVPEFERREDLLDDLTRPGIGEAGATSMAGLDRWSWMSRCAAVLQTRSVQDADVLAAMLEEGHEVAKAFRMERYWPGGRGAAEDEAGGPRVSAAWAILDVVYAACDPSQEQERLRDAMARWRRACVLPEEYPPRDVGSAGTSRLQPADQMVGMLTDNPAVGYARLIVQALRGVLPAPAHRVRVAVVFGGPVDGAHGKLTLAAQPGGPSGLYPDPRGMAFLAADPEFAESLGTAWRSAPTEIKNQCVTWDISDDDRPFREMVEGGSLGAAFGVGLQELTRAIRPMGPVRVRRLDPRCAITGGLSADNGLFPVGDYKPKLRAARRQRWRMVVPLGDPEATKHSDIPVRIAYARDLREAIRKSRMLRLRPHGFIAMILVLILAGSGAALTAFSQARAENHQHAVALATQLADDSEALGNVDPALARLEAVAAWRIDPSSAQARYALQNAASLAGIALLNGSASGEVTTMAFSPDGRILATVTGTTYPGSRGAVQLWDVARHMPIGGALAVPVAVSSVSFSPDGKMLAVGSASGGTQLWGVASRQLIAVLPAVRGYEVTSVAFSPDGKTLAAGLAFNSEAYKGTAAVTPRAGTQLWDVRTHRYSAPLLVGVSSITGDDITSVAFSSDGKILAAATSRDVELWNAESHQQIGLISSLGPANSLEFAPHGTTLAIATNGNVELWDATTGHQIATLGASIDVRYDSIAFSPDGRTLAVARNGVAQLWDAATGRPIGGSISGNGNGSIDCVTFSPDGTVLAAGSSLGTELWSVPAVIGNPAASLPISGFPTSLTFSGNSASLLVGTLTEARLWGVAARRLLSTPVSPGLGVLGVYVALSPDGKTAAIIQPPAPARLLHLTDREKVPLPGTESAFTLAFSPNGKMLAVGDPSYDGAQLWDVATGQRVATVSAGGSVTEEMAFTPDGKTLVTTDGTHLQFWDLARRHPEGPPTVVADRIYSVAFSPDGKTLAVATLAGTELIDSTTRRPDGPPLPTGTAYSLAWSPDGSVLAVATDAGTQLWNMATRQQIGPLLPLGPLHPGGQADALAWSPNGKTLAVATNLYGHKPNSTGPIPNSTGQVQLWNVGYLLPAETPSYLCKQAAQTLTPAQWSHYAPGTSYQNVCP